MIVPRIRCIGVPLSLLVLMAVTWQDAPRRESPEAIATARQPGLSNRQPLSAALAQRFDGRKERTGRRPAVQNGAQAAAVVRLATRLPGARVDFDPQLGSPQFIASLDSFLTGEDGRGLAMPANAATSRNDPKGIARAFLDEHAALFRHGAAALNAATSIRDYVTEHNGLHTMVWQQEHKGIRVFEGTLQAHVTRSGELVNMASRFLADPAASAQTGMPNHSAVRAHPPFDARMAVQVAAAALGDSLAVEDVRPARKPEGSAQRQGFDARPVLNEASAELVWLPLDAGAMRLCWETLTVSRHTGFMHRTLVDAASGERMVCQCLTEAISPASYTVFTSDSPTPMSPGHATPLSTQPAQVPRQLVTLDALDPTASPNGWIDDGGNQTLGNNVDAHLDLNADDIADTPRPQGTPPRVFDPPLDLAQAPSAYRDASVVNLFYWNNVLHDRLYALGFTEAAGNFQADNFGRGGAGNDAVQTDAQDGSGTDNAYFTTPPDGSPGRMEMFVFTGPSPDRDSSFDAEIIIHEYTHGLSNRLVGGGTGLSALQSRGMGEGWSDFFALSLLSGPADDPAGNYAKGAYSSYQIAGGFSTNYYFGIRRYPYSTNFLTNPLTFKDIDPARASAHPGVPRNGSFANTANEVHNMGEVWCVTLWEARANLIAKLGAVEGNDLMLRLATDGMKLAPPNPTFLQARDAILQAEMVHSGGANGIALWTAFARRGMGTGAVAPPSMTTTGVVENFNVPDALSITPAPPWTPVLTVGAADSMATTWTLSNTSDEPQTWAAAANEAWFSVSPAGGTLAAGTGVTVTSGLTAAASSLVTGSYTGAIIFTNTTSTAAQNRTVSLTVEPVTTVVFEETWESGTPGSAWAMTGTNSHRTQVTTSWLPHGGSRHLTMDAAGGGASSRNEATLTLNLAGRQNVHLSFWLKMFSDEPDGPPPSPFTGGADFDGVAVSADGGATWHEVLPLRTLTEAWQQFTLDLDSAIAARGLSYTPNFKIRFNHYDNNSISVDGFALDDIRVYYTVNNRLTLGLPPRATEGDAPATATLYATPFPASDMTVTLTNSDAGELTVPSGVTIPAGTGSVTFPVSFIDDAALDGTRSVSVTAASGNYQPATATVQVDDNETASLALNLPLSVSEGVSDVTGIVSAGVPVARDVAVSLVSSDTAKIIVPAQAVIPAGQSSVSFHLTVVDDTRIDGLQLVNLTASVIHWASATEVVEVRDNESTALVVTLPPALAEGATGGGTVSVLGTPIAPVTVNLTAVVPARVTVPAAVIIPAGATSVAFSVAAVQDSLAEESAVITVNAAAAGFQSAAGTVRMVEDDPHHFGFNVIPTQSVTGPIPITATALSPSNQPVTGFSGSGTFTASTSGGPVVLTPAVPLAFTGGVLSTNFNITTLVSDVAIHVSAAGAAGVSNSFDVIAGPLHHFTFAPIAPAQPVNVPFPVTITAWDALENIATSYGGTANLALAPVHSQFGTGTTIRSSPVGSTDTKSRSQVIYTPADVGGAKRLSGLALQIVSPALGTLSSFTIRLKHTSLSAYSTNSWENSSWTIVQNNNLSISTTGWVSIPFFIPFDYNGSQNLMVDFSFKRGGTTSNNCSCYHTSVGANRILNGFTSALGMLDPVQWSGTGSANVPPAFPSTSLPNLRFLTELPALTPLQTSAFTSGVWSGYATLAAAGSQFLLTAAGGTASGTSNPFDMSALDPVMVTVPLDGWDVTGYRGVIPAATKTWTLTRTGTNALNWSASADVPWLSLSATSGTIAASGSAPVTVSLNAAAAGLANGIYRGTVTFTNSTNGAGYTTRPVALTVQATGRLVLRAANAFDAAGISSGPFSSPSAPWVIENHGDTWFLWNASSSIPWLTFSQASGSVFPSLSTVPVFAAVTSAANSLPAGTYGGSVHFNNASTGIGNTAVTHTLSVLPPAPIAAAEPLFTGGAANTVMWSASAPGMEFETQMDTAPQFPGPVSSGWIGTTAHTFSGLAGGQLYHYRVRSRSTKSWDTWSQHDSAGLASGTRSNTVAGTPGLVLAPAAGIPITGRITNDSFEVGEVSSETGYFGGWDRNKSYYRMTAVIAAPHNTSLPLPTAGTKCLRLANYDFDSDRIEHDAGHFSAAAQFVNFTGSQSLQFDARTSGIVGGLWIGGVKTEIRIDGVTVWSRNTAGTWLNQSIPTSGYSGDHYLEIYIGIAVSGNHRAHYAYFDNLRLTSPAGYAVAGSVISPAISTTPGGTWGHLYLERDVPAGTSLTVDVLDPAQQLLTSGLTSEADLSVLPSLTGQTALLLRANLGTSSSAVTPRLNRWTLTSRRPENGPALLSGWSNVVASTQDAAPPLCAVTSALASNAASYILAGTASDLSGLAGVTVNGQPVSTTDAFSHWSLPLALAPGVNSFTITGTDNAVPANVTTLPVTVTYSADADGDHLPDAWESEYGLDPGNAAADHGTHGDPDGDGLTNLIEYALGYDPRTHDATAAPRVEFAVNPADGRLYLNLTYRRRAETGFIFQPVVSSNLATWNETPGSFEEISSVQTGDGLTETVWVRLLPATDTGIGRRFVRLRITVPQ